jgi:hypothetical protein
MRQAYYDTSLFLDENNDLQLICLGYDYAAEHEIGIKRLKEYFGISEFDDTEHNIFKTIKNKIFGKKLKFGIDRRMVTKVPDHLTYGEFSITENKKKKRVFFVGFTDSSWRTPKENEDFFINKIKQGINFDKSFSSWWDEKEFLVASVEQKIPMQIFKALSSLDAAIFLAGSKNPFAGSGLTISVKSKMKEEDLKEIENTDRERYEMILAGIKSGITQKVSKSDKRYFALNPAWKKDIHNSSETKYSIVFWLNPMEQNKYNSGWYTVEELEQWVNNQGPVIKTQ